MNVNWAYRIMLQRLFGLFVFLSGVAFWLPAAAQNVVPTMLMRGPQIQALVAPVALYPDGLLAQIVLASRSAIQIAQAQAMSSSYALLPEDKAAEVISRQNWDPSVKVLVAFPAVLSGLANNYEWTREVGELYKTRSRDLLQAIQALRQRALAAGSLQSGPAVKVVTNQNGEITIDPVTPNVVIVPQYDPNLVYGPWPYPASPPASIFGPAVNVLMFAAVNGPTGMLWASPQWGSGGIAINESAYKGFAQRYGAASSYGK